MRPTASLNGYSLINDFSGIGTQDKDTAGPGFTFCLQSQIKTQRQVS